MALKVIREYEEVGGPKKYLKSRRLKGIRLENTPSIRFKTVSSEWYRQLGIQFRVARQQRGLSQATLARSIGSAQASISRFEAGQVNVTIDFIAKYLNAIGKTLVTEVIDDNSTKKTED